MGVEDKSEESRGEERTGKAGRTVKDSGTEESTGTSLEEGSLCTDAIHRSIQNSM